MCKLKSGCSPNTVTDLCLVLFVMHDLDQFRQDFEIICECVDVSCMVCMQTDIIWVVYCTSVLSMTLVGCS
jgi:hypothetical protein